MDIEAKLKLTDALRARIKNVSASRKCRVLVHQKNLREFVGWAMVKYPHFDFVASECSNGMTSEGVDEYHVHSLIVRHRNVEIGHIKYGHYRGRYALCLKVGAEAQSTIDLNRAKKDFQRRFTAVDDLKLLRKKTKDLERFVKAQTDHLHKPVWRARVYLQEELVEFAIKHIDQFVAENPSAQATELVNALNKQSENKYLDDMLSSVEKCKDLFVAVENPDGSWVSRDPEYFDKSVVFASWDDLPEWAQQRIGILRLVENDGCLEGVGVKAGEVYAVYPETAHDQN